MYEYCYYYYFYLFFFVNADILFSVIIQGGEDMLPTLSSLREKEAGDGEHEFCFLCLKAAKT
jgi:hypothetical protein